MAYHKWIGVSVLALVLTMSAMAQVELTGPGIVSSLTGGYIHQSGSNLGMYRPFYDNRQTNSGLGLGVAFWGPTEVEYLIIQQFNDQWNRRLAQEFDVYANGQFVGKIKWIP